jgi:hypothetical protein
VLPMQHRSFHQSESNALFPKYFRYFSRLQVPYIDRRQLFAVITGVFADRYQSLRCMRLSLRVT